MPMPYNSTGMSQEEFTSFLRMKKGALNSFKRPQTTATTNPAENSRSSTPNPPPYSPATSPVSPRTPLQDENFYASDFTANPVLDYEEEEGGHFSPPPPLSPNLPNPETVNQNAIAAIIAGDLTVDRGRSAPNGQGNAGLNTNATTARTTHPHIRAGLQNGQGGQHASKQAQPETEDQQVVCLADRENSGSSNGAREKRKRLADPTEQSTHSASFSNSTAKGEAGILTVVKRCKVYLDGSEGSILPHDYRFEFTPGPGFNATNFVARGCEAVMHFNAENKFMPFEFEKTK